MAEGGLLPPPEYFQNPNNTGILRDYRTIWSTAAFMPSSYPIVKPDENPNLNTGLVFSWGPQTQVPAPSPFWGILDAQSGMCNYENIERPYQNVEPRFPRQPSDSGIVATFAVSSSSSSSPSPQSPALAPLSVTDAQPTRPSALCLCQEGNMIEGCPHMQSKKCQRSLAYLTSCQVAVVIVKINDVLDNNTLHNPTPYSRDPVLVGHMCKVTNHQQHTNRVDLAGFIRQLVPDTEDNTSVRYVSKINFKIDVPATPVFSSVTEGGNSERVTELEQPEENVAESQESETRQPLLSTPADNQRQPLLPTPPHQHRRPLLRTPTPDQRSLEINMPVNNRGSGALSDSSSSSNSPNSSNHSNYSNHSLTDRYNRIRNRQSTTPGRRRAASPNNQRTNNQSPVSEHRRRRYRAINRTNSTSTPRNTNNTQSSPTSSHTTQSTSSDNTQSPSVDNVQPTSESRDNNRNNRSSRRIDTRIILSGISTSHNRNPSDTWRERSNVSNNRQPNGQTNEGINLTETPPSHNTDTNESNRGNTSLITTIDNNRRLFPRNESPNIESQSSESLALQLPSMNPQPPTPAIQLSAFNPQPPTLALQLTSINTQPPTLALQLPSIVPQPPQLNRHKKVINGYMHIFNGKKIITDGSVKVTHFLDDRVNFESLPARVQVTDFRVLIYGKEVILAEDADLFILAMNNTPCHLLSSNEHTRKGHLVTICYDEACPSVFRVDIVVETGNPGPVFEFKYKKRCHEE